MATEEVRHFQRYARSLGFTLKVRNMPFRVETLNYSLQGLGVLLKGQPPIKRGDLLHIGRIDIGNAGDAFVAWTKTMSEGTLAGLSLVRPIEGCFRHFRLSDIVTGFQKGRRTGTFAITGESRKKIFLKSGELVFASSGRPEDRLDMFLLRKGMISEDQYYRAVEERWTSGKSSEAVLVGLGFLKPKDLVEAVKMQAEEIIMSLFSDEEGCFTFEEGSLPAEEIVQMKLSAENLIYRGLKSTSSNLILDQYRPPMDAVIRFSSSQHGFWTVTLDEKDRKILTLVDGKNSVRDILKLSPYGEKGTLRTLCALVGAGVIEQGSRDEASPADSQGGPGRLAADINKEKARLRFEEGKKQLTWGQLGVAERLLAEAVRLDPSEAPYHYNLGIALRRQGKNREAEKAFSTALKIDPMNADVIDELNRLHGKGR